MSSSSESSSESNLGFGRGFNPTKSRVSFQRGFETITGKIVMNGGLTREARRGRGRKEPPGGARPEAGQQGPRRPLREPKWADQWSKRKCRSRSSRATPGRRCLSSTGRGSRGKLRRSSTRKRRARPVETPRKRWAVTQGKGEAREAQGGPQTPATGEETGGAPENRAGETEEPDQDRGAQEPNPGRDSEAQAGKGKAGAEKAVRAVQN